MAPRTITVAQCSRSRIPVFFDASVIIDAIREDADTRSSLTKLDRELRLLTLVTWFEVAFQHARSDRHLRRRLDREKDWVQNHFAQRPIPLSEQVGKTFERFTSERAPHLQTGLKLGDVLLACHARAWRRGGTLVAVATRDKHFLEFGVPLVEEFLPANVLGPKI